MQTVISKINEQCSLLIENASSTKELSEIRIKYFGKNGEFTSLMKGLKDVKKEDKPVVGKMLNDCKKSLEAMLDEKFNELSLSEKSAKLKDEEVDITLSGKPSEVGGLHVLSKVRDEVVNIFTGLGFTVSDGPEIETDYFCFQMLNIPKDHPARDMQDSFFINDNLILRTQTSSMQVRTMLKQQPPIRIINPGKVYRVDSDATHSPMFQQIEGLVVDKNVTLCDLKGSLEVFAKTLFDANTKVRFRPSYFPFTEPSVEVDVSCPFCGGKGCNLCKGTGWIEILGAGIVNPVVLDNCGIDSKQYSGFAFGMGVERIAMIKYGIPDMRILFSNDMRFLKQYK
ncbi:MAG: phenylalanine--tRNA ligase subunit alpha [Clostridia bacterium]|nr:phenylalanine--tRNA ligase subunit alpha [Clostridia bacterium]MDY5263442.1 phenylalanine--tRNA ligase subunit alpha [Eubacteriales bacterium]MDY5439825.1 phenylalanine--tRNA ligase subunit alpha [Eubacteriales bacterium]